MLFNKIMRRGKLCCFFSICTVGICLIYYIIVSVVLGKLGTRKFVDRNCEESNFYHYNRHKEIFTFTNKTTILKQTPDLHWIEQLNEITALQTIPTLSSPNCSESVFLVILVVSQPDHFEQRNGIRSSWGKLFHSKKARDVFKMELGSYKHENIVKTVFLLGRSETQSTQALVDYENDLYEDIVSGNFPDVYKNLVLKTRLGITWAHSQCTSEYLLKTDDDVFVNIKQLVKWLGTSPAANFYTGWCNYRSKVSRNKLSKWYVSVDEYFEDEFPPYCLGGGYVISSDIIPKIMGSLYTQKVFSLEDVFVGIAINKLNIQPQDNRGLFNLLFSGVKDVCDYLNLLLVHPVQPAELLNMHIHTELALDSCR